MLNVPLIGAGCALNGPCGALPTATPMRNDVFLVLHREIEVVPAALLCGVGRPHLTASPGDVLDVERDAVVGDLPADAIHREHVIVAHREVAAEIVRLHAGVDVVGRIDEDPAVEDVRRGVGGIDIGDERLVQELARGLRRLRSDIADGENSLRDTRSQQRGAAPSASQS